MSSTQRPLSPEPGRVRSRLAAALLGLAWVWGFWTSGGVSLEARSHLLTLSSLALILALWPGRGTSGLGQRFAHRHLHWLSVLVGLGLYGGVLVAPVIQLPTWILALLAWTTWQVGRCVLGDDPWLRRALPSGLLAVCLMQALLGLWQVAQGEVVRGTLGNPNHFAGAMALAGGLVAGWFLVGPWWRDDDASASTWGPLTGRWAAGGLVVLLLTVVILGQSRGGLAVLLTVWGLAYLRWRSAGGWATGVDRARFIGLMLWGGGVFAVTWWTVPRLSVDGLERRLQVYNGTLELIADHPWGVGPGLYRWLFRPYQRLESNKFFDYAHNDYLQVVAEWGWLVGGVLLAWLVWRWIGAWHLADSRIGAWHPADDGAPGSRSGAPGSRSAWHPTDDGALAVLAAVTAPLLHAWVDFDLHIPVLLMAVVALLAWTATPGAPSSAKREPTSGSPPLAKGELEGDSSLVGASAGRAGLGQKIPPHPPFSKGGTRENHPPFSKGGTREDRLWPDHLIWIGLTVVAVLACWRVEVLAFAGASVRGSDDPAVYAAALEHAPEAPSLHFGLAMLYRDAVEHRSPKLAHEHFQEAVRLNPHSWRYRFELGRFYEQMGRDDDAAAAYGEALQRNPWEADDQRRIAGFYLRRGTGQGKALGRALLAQSAAEDRRLLRAGGELLLASGHGLRELVAWWPRDGASQPDLLAVLCTEFSERPLESGDVAPVGRRVAPWIGGRRLGQFGGVGRLSRAPMAAGARGRESDPAGCSYWRRRDEWRQGGLRDYGRRRKRALERRLRDALAALRLLVACPGGDELCRLAGWRARAWMAATDC